MNTKATYTTAVIMLIGVAVLTANSHQEKIATILATAIVVAILALVWRD